MIHPLHQRTVRENDAYHCYYLKSEGKPITCNKIKRMKKTYRINFIRVKSNN